MLDQNYDLQVYPSYAYEGNTAVIKCLTPSYVREYLEVKSWMWGSEVIVGDVAQGNFQKLVLFRFPDLARLLKKIIG